MQTEGIMYASQTVVKDNKEWTKQPVPWYKRSTGVCLVLTYGGYYNALLSQRDG